MACALDWDGLGEDLYGDGNRVEDRCKIMSEDLTAH